jgi:hypothetical protein
MCDCVGWLEGLWPVTIMKTEEWQVCVSEKNTAREVRKNDRSFVFERVAPRG